MDLRKVDLLDRFERTLFSEARPDVLIHCAGMTNVDGCEQDPELARLQNAELTARLASATPAQCLFVYITTDGIFSGDHPFAVEDDTPSPKTAYARTKLAGEDAVRNNAPNHLIIRTNFFGWSSGRKKTSGEWLYQALETRQEITLFDDFFYTPIYVVDLVNSVNALIDSDHRGTFHIGGRDRVSKYEFGQAVAEAGRMSMDSVRRGSIDDAHLAADRPKDMSLCSDRYTRLTGVGVPGCKESAQRFVSHRATSLGHRFESE